MTQQAPLRVGFLMDQIAGHVTNYRNLRHVISQDSRIEPTWVEIEFFRPNGRLERVSQGLRFVPPYITGVSRGAIDLRNGLRRGPFDVIYTNSSIAVLFVRQFCRTPTLLHLDSTPIQIDRMPTYPSPADPVVLAAMKKRMSTKLFTSVAAIQAWSAWARNSFVDDYGVSPARITVNPPGIDVKAWRPPARLERRTGPVRVLFVGGDFDRKGGALLLDWFHRQTPGSIELHVVTRDTVEETAGLYVHRNLLANSPDLLRLFHDADVFALPSLGECFGIASVEAMSAGLPVVASDAGGTADIIEDGRNGIIVGAGSQVDLDLALNTLVADASLRSRMSSHAHNSATKFDITESATNILNCLLRISRIGN